MIRLLPFPIAVLALAGAALPAADLTQTFHNETERTLVLAAKPGLSQESFLLTHHLCGWFTGGETEHQHRVRPASGELPRLHVRAGESVDFEPLTALGGYAFAHFCVYREDTMQHLARLDFQVLPHLDQAQLFLEVAAEHRKAFRAVEHPGCILSSAYPGWRLEEIATPAQGCCVIQ